LVNPVRKLFSNGVKIDGPATAEDFGGENSRVVGVPTAFFDSFPSWEAEIIRNF